MPAPQTGVIQDTTVTFIVQISDEFGAIKAYSFRILFIQKLENDGDGSGTQLDKVAVNQTLIQQQTLELEKTYENLVTLVDFQPNWGQIQQTDRNQRKKYQKFPLPKIR